MFTRRSWFVAATLVVALLGTSGVVVLAPSLAYACILGPTGGCYRFVTGTVTTANLNVRAAPWGTVLDDVPNGYSGVVDCYVQASDGSYWDWLYDSRIGRAGWVYDPDLYTGGNIYQQVNEMHASGCGSIPLTIPSHIAAVATGTGQIHVTWTDTNSGAANYVVSNGNVSSADLARGTSSYDWSGLAPNTYMCFTVTAKENGTQSPWSPYACTTTRSLTPPTNVIATATSTSAIHVTWSDTTGGGAQFVVDNGNTASADLPAGTSSYDWTGLQPHTYMCFTLASKQSGQQSDWTPWACATTADPPSCPAGINCSETGAFQPNACLSFNPPVADDFNTATPDLDGLGTDTPSTDVTDITNAESYPGIFRGLGFNTAASFFEHYLDTSGSDYDFDATEAYRASAGFASYVDGTVVQRLGWYGSTGHFDSGYLDFPIDAWQNGNWHYAVGHGYYRVVGTRQSDGTWSVRLWLTSYYQYRPGVDFNIPNTPVPVVFGASLRRLVQIGFARNFREVGTGQLSYDANGNPL